MFKKMQNVAEFEAMLNSTGIMFQRNGSRFELLGNSYTNCGKTFTVLTAVVTKNGVEFYDQRERQLSNLCSTTQIENSFSQILNIFGLVSKRLLVLA